MQSIPGAGFLTGHSRKWSRATDAGGYVWRSGEMFSADGTYSSSGEEFVSVRASALF